MFSHGLMVDSFLHLLVKISIWKTIISTGLNEASCSLFLHSFIFNLYLIYLVADRSLFPQTDSGSAEVQDAVCGSTCCTERSHEHDHVQYHEYHEQYDCLLWFHSRRKKNPKLKKRGYLYFIYYSEMFTSTFNIALHHQLNFYFISLFLHSVHLHSLLFCF